MQRKPKNIDEFIEGNKDAEIVTPTAPVDHQEKQQSSAVDVPQKKPKIKLDLDELLTKDKTFPVVIPRKLHEAAKKAADKHKLSLHDYILIALRDKVVADSE